jgi:hypothetical protein
MKRKTTGFHLRKIANAACQYPGDLRAKAEAFLRVSKIPYERAVRHIRDADPDDFVRTIHDKPTELIFAGLQDGQTALIVRVLVASLCCRSSFSWGGLTIAFPSSQCPLSSEGKSIMEIPVY